MNSSTSTPQSFGAFDLNGSIMDLGYKALSWGVVATVLGYVLSGLAKAALRPRLSTLRHLPGPENNQFLMGQGLRILLGAGPNDLYLEWTRRWPEAPFIRCLSWFNSEVLLVNNIEACREVLQTNAYSFVKPGFFQTLVGEFLGTGILFAVGNEHKKLRRLVAGPLSRPSIRGFMPIYHAQARQLCDDIVSEMGERGEEESVVEFEKHLTKATQNVIGASLLGKEMHHFRSPSTPLTFDECCDGLLSQSPLGQLITFINPFIPLRWLPVAANLDFLRAKAALKTIMTEIIEARTAEILEARKLGLESPSEDLLSRMIEASIAEDQKLSHQQLIDITLQIASAGHDTTTSGLVWMMHALAVYPDVQDRLRSEVLRAQLGDADAKAIDDLPYLNNFVRESLRVYSPALMAPWEADKDLVIAGVHVPKGTTIQTVPAMVQQNPKIWGDDADSFIPERWDNLGDDASSPFSLELFLNGPRMCPGKALAMLEMKVIVVEVIKSFHLEAVDRNPGFKQPSLTLRPKGGMHLKVRRLN